MRVSAMFAAALGLALCGGESSAQAPADRVAERAVVNDRVSGDGGDSWPERRTDFPDGVTGIGNLAYSTLNGYRPLELDLFLPPASAGGGPHPLVIYVHGGGWAGGGRRLSAAFANWPKVLASMAAQGFVVASISYRFGREAPFPAAIHDTKTAILWLRANAGRYGIDRERVGIWGASAGGQLAALAATTCGSAELAPAKIAPRLAANVERPEAAPPLEGQSDCVQAAVTWYGVFDFTTLARPAEPRPDYRENPYLGCGNAVCTQAQLRAPSPIAYVTRAAPPFLVIAGDADRTVPTDQSRAFHERLRAAGVTSELVILPGIDHSFIGPDAETTRATSRRMLGRTVQFFVDVLGKAPTGR